jgi:hypothetical protein
LFRNAGNAIANPKQTLNTMLSRNALNSATMGAYGAGKIVGKRRQK